ncbi:energy transducer TonB [Mucilaginibacter celer]|nr:energy transducer TonB [Mucilaginibacter celer]
MKGWLVSGLMLLSVTSFAQSKLKKAGIKPDTAVYTSVDMVPEFPGGLERFGAYLAKTKIPALDTTERLPGRMHIQVIVEKDGSLTHFKIVRSSGSKIMDRAYLDRIRQSPKWKPGLLHGRPVRVTYSIPIIVCFTGDE